LAALGLIDRVSLMPVGDASGPDISRGVRSLSDEGDMTATLKIPHGRIGELMLYFLRLGLLGFGGPVALVGQMERELVAERGWLTKEQNARGDRGVSIAAGTARDPGGHLHRVSARRFWGRGPAAGHSSCRIS